MPRKKAIEPDTPVRELPDPYPYAVPRWLHKPDCAPLLVLTPEACQDALDDGYVIHPHWVVT